MYDYHKCTLTQLSSTIKIHEDENSVGNSCITSSPSQAHDLSNSTLTLMSYTQTAAPSPAAVGTVLLHPRPLARNSGVIVLVPLLANLPAESRSSTLRVIADVESPHKQSTLVIPLSAASDLPSAIPGLPYKRKRDRAKVNSEAPRKPLADSGLPCRLAAESVLSSPTTSELPCKPMAESHSDSPGKQVTEPSHSHAIPSDAPYTSATKPTGDPPPPKTLALPAETWFRVLAFVFALPPASIGAEERRARAGLMRVSKTFKVIIRCFLS